MTYQQVNQQKQQAKDFTRQTVVYDENGLYVRREKWPGMNWICKTKRLAVYFRDSFQCMYCGKTIFDNIRLTLDHVKPFYKYTGSATDTKNLVTCCQNCNFRKQDLTLTDFAKVKATETGLLYTDIVRKVKNALRRKTDVKQAGKIIRAQKNWTNIINHVKDINH